LWPSPASSPWTRRHPHVGFSEARHLTRARRPAGVDGRPGSRGAVVVHFQVIRRRCQPQCQHGDDRSVRPRQPRPPDLALQHRELMARDEDLGVFPPVRTGQRRQSTEQTISEQIPGRNPIQRSSQPGGVGKTPAQRRRASYWHPQGLPLTLGVTDGDQAVLRSHRGPARGRSSRGTQCTGTVFTQDGMLGGDEAGDVEDLHGPVTGASRQGRPAQSELERPAGHGGGEAGMTAQPTGGPERSVPERVPRTSTGSPRRFVVRTGWSSTAKWGRRMSGRSFSMSWPRGGPVRCSSPTLTVRRLQGAVAAKVLPTVSMAEVVQRRRAGGGELSAGV
jgi:hypothetical protein